MTWESTHLVTALVMGGLFQALILVFVQSIYLKRSSLGVRLESLRAEVAQRDREIRLWVKDSIGQMEADSMQRDADLRRAVLDVRDSAADLVRAEFARLPEMLARRDDELVKRFHAETFKAVSDVFTRRIEARLESGVRQLNEQMLRASGKLDPANE